jgi:hypothetical protein
MSPTLALAAVVVAELVALYLLLNGNGWAYDDNLSMELANQFGFTWHWLSYNLFGHFEVAHRAIFSLQLHLMPVDYRWALLTMLLTLGAAVFLFERSLRMLVGAGWAPLLAAAYFGISVLLVAPMQWWSTGLEVFPTLVFDLLCLWAYLRYETDRDGLWIAVSAGALAVGLLFYEKPAYMPLYLILIRVLLLGGDLRPRAIAATIWRERWMWAALIAVVVAYTIVREAAGAGSIASGGSASVSAWLQFARIAWAQTLVPGLFGLRIPASGLSGVQVGTAIALQLVVIAGVAISLWRKPSAWRPWAVLAVCVVATIVLVGQGRLADFGPSVGNDPRYFPDLAWLVPLLVTLAFSRRGVFVPVIIRGRSSLRLPHSVALVALVTGILVAYAARSIATDVSLQRDWQGHPARQWEVHMEHGLAVALRAGRHVMVANNDAPWFMVEQAFAPYNQLSYIFPAYRERVSVDGPLTGSLFILDGQGRPHAAAIGRTVASFELGHQGCVAPSSSGVNLTRRFPTPAAAGPYYVRVTYRSAAGSNVLVYADNGRGFSSWPIESVLLPSDAHHSLAWLGQGSPRGVLLHVSGVSATCVERLDIVRLKAMR